MAQGLLCIYHGAHLLSLYTDQLYWDERERQLIDNLMIKKANLAEL